MNLPEMSETQFFREHVRPLLVRFGWHYYHTVNARKSAPGFPDLVCWRERIIHIELKKESGLMSADQKRVKAELEAAGAEYHVFRPSQLESLARVLARTGEKGSPAVSPATTGAVPPVPRSGPTYADILSLEADAIAANEEWVPLWLSNEGGD